MEETIESNKLTLVQNSYGRCLEGGKFINLFYEIFLSTSEEVKAKFINTDFDEQNRLLRHGLNLVIMYAAGNFAGKAGLKRIKESHSKGRMNIHPKYYILWKKALIQTVSQKDPKYNNEIKNAWDVVLDKGIEFIVSGY